MIEALRELEGIIAMDESSAKRLQWFRIWKHKWLEQLTHFTTVDTLAWACHTDKARLEEYLARDTAHEIGKLLVKDLGLSWTEQGRVDAEGLDVGDYLLPTDLRYLTARSIYERRTRRFYCLRREPK